MGRQRRVHAGVMLGIVLFSALMTVIFPPDSAQAQIIITLILPTFTPTATRTPTPVNVGNFVWDDLDKDGRQDAGEPGLAGVTVQLWNSTKTSLIDQATTNASGNYTLTAPGPGNYRVRVVLPSFNDAFSPIDSVLNDDQTDSDINPSGTDLGFTNVYVFGSNLISITTIDAGIIIFRTPTPTRTPTPINVGNFIWDDLDADGQQDAGEPGLAGVTVQLWNAAKTSLIDQATTNANGNYTLVAPTPGDYRVRVVLPSFNDAFSPKDQAGGNDQLDSDINTGGPDLGFTSIYTFGSNLISITTIDAGLIIFRTPTPTRTPTPINIGNFIWNDLNANGIQDAGEPGLVGITVQLWNDTKTQLIDSTITNANGNYTLVAPVPGNYRVRVIKPVGASFSPINQGVDDLKDSDIVNLALLSDFGFTNTITIASNVISITTIDCGIFNVPATSTPTPPPTATHTATITPSALPGTPQPNTDWKLILPIVMR